MATVTVTDSSFEVDVIKSVKPVLVDFWAEWCGPCKVMEPVLDQLSEEMADTLTIAKLNVDENTEHAGQFNVESIPTMLLFVNGQPVERLVGVMPKESVIEKITAAIT
jgi:thioredoxin 1